jgi:hypothetical protein
LRKSLLGVLELSEHRVQEGLWTVHVMLC